MGAPSPPVLDSDCAYPKEAAERAARRTAEKRMVKMIREYEKRGGTGP